MPLNAKGKKFIKKMRATYGAKQGTAIFYKMINEGKLKDVEGAEKKKK